MIGDVKGFDLAFGYVLKRERAARAGQPVTLVEN